MYKRLFAIQSCRVTRIPIFAPLHRCQFSGCTPRQRPVPSEPSVFVEDNFAKHTLFVLDVGKRFIKISLVGLFILGTVAATAYEATHLWVETVELAPEQDDEVKRWEWHDETEKWSGDTAKGGTDPALGFRGRHTVRAAWMASNWGVGYSTAVIGSDAHGQDGLVGPAGLRVIDASLQRTEDFLNSAISIADNQTRNGHLHAETIPQLLTRHASILERLGPQSLQTSKSQYERAWLGFSGQGINAAHIAAKLGDISSRLDQTNDAILWWSKAIQLIRGEVLERLETLPAVLGTTPESPRAQRILSTTLVLLSAFYARSGQLQQAQAIEEAALGMLRSIQLPKFISTVPPPHTLHTLYLLQRASLLSVHLAEVLHAQHKPVSSSIEYLTSAVESSEKVTRALIGHSLSPTEGLSDALPTADTQLLPVFAQSRSMKRTANTLLRDARRTTAEAWNLIGILNETHTKDLRAAFHCYQRAVRWAGVPDPQSGTLQAAEGTLESDWAIFWGNYTRTKRLVEEKL